MAAFVFAYNLEGGNNVPVAKKFPVAASQVLKTGDAVVLASGQVTKGGNGFGRALGVMAQDSNSQTAGTQVRVYIAQPNHVWRAVATADATSLVLSSRTVDLNASEQVNVADTTGGCMEIVELGPKGNTDVYVTFTACEFG